jgi:hypothetical protein
MNAWYNSYVNNLFLMVVCNLHVLKKLLSLLFSFAELASSVVIAKTWRFHRVSGYEDERYKKS